MNKLYQVKGMTCVICKKNVEQALSSVEGVNNAQVNLLENEVSIDFDENKVNDQVLSKAIKDAGYELIINDKRIDFELIKLIISIVLMIYLMYVSMSTMNNHSPTSLIIQLILSTIIIIINFQYYKSGLIAFIHQSPNMNSLVSLSSIISYIYSVISMFDILIKETNSNLYFETAAMILVIVAIGKRIEKNTKAKTVKVVRGLATLIPMQANLIIDNDIKIVKTNELKKNDLIRIYPGESIPQDGIIVNGFSSVNESMITGESLPVDKKVNDSVIGGTINGNGTIDVKINKGVNNSVLSNIINQAKQATMSKIPIERFADKMASYFVYIVLGIAIVTCLVWLIISKNIETALNFALSVLVISCPCAFGIATPACVGVAVGKAAKQGLLIKRPEILEIAGKTKTIIFDKTGTLTNNKLEIAEEIALDKSFFDVLASLEKTSNHPIAKTILDKYNNSTIAFDESKYIPGKGIIAKLNDDIYKAGNLNLIDNIDQKYIAYAKENNYSFISVSKNSNILGYLFFTDKVNKTSKQAIEIIKKRDIRTIICTGDNKIATSKIANYLNIKNYKFDVKPEDKNKLIQEEKEKGIVMMVGDGVNDAIALTSADVSIAINDASDIASASSDVLLMNDDLRNVPFLYDLAKKTMQTIKQNILWALGYNAICIPIAAGVFYKLLNLKLNPIICSIVMLFSSMFVILNALRINMLSKEEK